MDVVDELFLRTLLSHSRSLQSGLSRAAHASPRYTVGRTASQEPTGRGRAFQRLAGMVVLTGSAPVRRSMQIWVKRQVIHKLARFDTLAVLSEDNEPAAHG